MVKLVELLGNRCADFELLNRVEKKPYVLGSELWEKFVGKEYNIIVNVWEGPKVSLILLDKVSTYHILPE